MKLYFVTVNDFKANEVSAYLDGTRIQVHVIRHQIQEILNLDLNVIVRDKALKAYKQTGLPCVVEHGGLLIKELGGLPGGLSKVVWDTVGEKICDFLKEDDSRAATARSVIGYCDGKRIRLFTGDTEGSVAVKARGTYLFQWDPIFIPNGAKKTYAEMGFPQKAKYSQAAKAWKQLADELSRHS